MNDNEALIDPSLLKDLTPSQRQEALEAAAAAKRAEERAEQRALERLLAKKEAERKAQTTSIPASAHVTTTTSQIKFVPKRQRQQQTDVLESTSDTTGEVAATSKPPLQSKDVSKVSSSKPSTSGTANGGTNNNNFWTDKERLVVRQTYLGKTGDTTTTAAVPEAKERKGKRKDVKTTKKTTFRFEWDNTDDTLDQSDPLYNAAAMKKKRQASDPLLQDTSNKRTAATKTQSVLTKPLDQMTARDWRIFRENYEIVVKGGRAPPPLRSFREGGLHPSLLQAIENTLGYKEPTPIQRQAIPIGLQRRDLIGIAETGSGKTVAFGLPLLQYILDLSSSITSRVAQDGPLALVLAPTRELALQIHGEFLKLLSHHPTIRAAAVVGGQSIQHQAQELREGCHVVIGTPGRINDCIEMAYLVLNQCCYIVMDEADRLVDMGFLPQMESILDAMGGLLKSESEAEAYRQEEEDKELQKSQGLLPKHRLTAMFSATMPMEVERLAQRYLRHPAVISIGDQDSSKNNRIVQRIVFLSSPSQKEKALRDLILNPRYMREKVIVFVNEKKHADGVGRMIERFGRPCVVLHGGKSQEQREENLAQFRRGGVVLVATDVAGRGLDIPNVAHVINFDLPTRSIDSYSHRIGRTGRAGNQGLATSLLTAEDEGIMAPLKQYLESTGQPVPDKLARHPAANANTAHGNLIY